MTTENVDTTVVDQADDTQEVDEVTEEYVPPTKEQYEELQAKLTKANDEAKKYRLRAKEKAAAPVVDEDAVTTATKQVEEVWKTRFINQAASLAFAREGVEASPRLLKLLDLSELEVTEDGEVDGLSDQIDEIKTSFPQLFVVKPKRATKTDLGRTGTAPAKKTADLFAEAFQGMF